jgi:hypothetical protein
VTARAYGRATSLHAFIAAHGASRFERINGDVDDDAPMEQQAMNRAPQAIGATSWGI